MFKTTQNPCKAGQQVWKEDRHAHPQGYSVMYKKDRFLI